MKVDIWFPFYVNDYIADTMALSNREHGMYLLLMIHCWKKGVIPKDIEKLKKITKTSEEDVSFLIGILEDFFEEHEDFYINNRLSAEKTKAENRSKRAQENGRLGGRPKEFTSIRGCTAIKKQLDKDWYEMVLFFDNKCLCCEEKLPEGAVPLMDHIIPKSLGGQLEITNIQPLCSGCNRDKSNKHTTDYRLKFIEDIPEKLKSKWFIAGKLEETYRLKLENQNKTSSHSHSHSHSESYKPPEKKHKYGEYNHVRLTDKQFKKLEEDYGSIHLKELIVKLDEGIEIHGYRYKNHNLTIRKWNPLNNEKPTIKSKELTGTQKEIEKYQSYIDSDVFPEDEKIKFRDKINELEGSE
ncbi:MAG: DUF1376 domain-containing protein [Candidatus Stahlbacteria bacterium]|nr:MAG: DUF1376 domain-containing protein [Candidatus Stahlbacteria bacterium]